MSRKISQRLLMSALVLGAAAMPLAVDGNGPRLATAQAQRLSFNISFDTFRDELAPYGDWVYSDRWGMVWLPDDGGPDFHPYYTGGRWEPTREYGWTWASDHDWGDIVFHYGRWVHDPYDGWMWIPGYVWSPGWVVWRGSDQYMGWMPLPPDDDFLRGYEDVSFRYSRFDNYDDYYGYARWYGRDYDANRFARAWIFIGIGDMGLRDYRRSAMREPRQIINVMNQTRNVTNYTVVNNYIVNRSVEPQLDRAGVRRGGPRAASDVLRRPQMVRTVDAGREVERRGVQEAPRGRGMANSAPRPDQAVTERLSERANRRGSGRLFTRENINNASLPQAPGGAVERDRGARDQGRPDRERAERDRNDSARENQQRADQQRADQQRADQQRADQQRQANEERARQNDQRRVEQERRANEDRNREAQQRRANEDRANQQRQANEERAQRNEQRRAEQDRARADQQRQANEQRRAEQDRARADQQRQANEQRAREDEQRRAAQDQRANQQRAAEAERRANEERGRANRAQPPQQTRDNPDRGKGRDDGGNGRGRRDRD